MKVKWKRLGKISAFLILNPHLLAMTMIGFVIMAIWKALYHFADKLDDAARGIKKLDLYLGSKEYPSWFKSLID
ncbi:Uncharacterised protein [Salmonella enterica subsp. enterica]|nr:Uncharacterised protein [Salmonella enterica subsp. enterica]